MLCKSSFVVCIVIAFAVGVLALNFQDNATNENEPVRDLQRLISETKWQAEERKDGVLYVIAKNQYNQGFLRVVAENLKEPLYVLHENSVDRWFRLFGGLKLSLGGSVQTRKALQAKELYWRNEFKDHAVADGYVIFIASNGDSIVYVNESRYCWIRFESHSVLDAFESIDDVARFFILAIKENCMIDSYSWEESKRSPKD
jgi:hypothetical protein